MPTYEYACPEGHEFELFQKMSEQPRARCPVCGKTAIRQISGGAGLVFKGSGFYITDYGKDGKGPRKEGADKGDKAERAERSEGAQKAEKSEKSERVEKTERTEKQAPSAREGTGRSEAKASTGDASGKSQGKSEPGSFKPGLGKGKGKASSE